MADKKEDEAPESGSGGAGFELIPKQHIFKIVAIFMVIGIVGKILAPDWVASLGPVILDPFASIMWVYGFMMLMFALFGDRKSGMDILKAATPMIMLALVLPQFLGFGYEQLVLPIIFIIAAPLIGTAINKRGLEKAGLSYAEGEKKEEGEAATVPAEAKEILGQLEGMMSAAGRERGRLGTIYADLDTFYTNAKRFAGKLSRAKEKDIRKNKGAIATEAGTLKATANTLDGATYGVRSAVPPIPKSARATLDALLSAIDVIKRRLAAIENALS